MKPPSVYKVLRIIAGNPSIGRRELADLMGVCYESCSITKSVESLKSMGWVSCTFKKDSLQRISLNVTDKGMEVLDVVNALEAFE